MKLTYSFLALLVFFSSCAKNDTIIEIPTQQPTATNTVTLPFIAPIGDDTEDMQGSILLDQANVAEYTTRSWQGIPSVGIDNNDIMYSIWYTGATGEGVGNYITLSISKDGGLTWFPNKMIITPNIGTNVRFFDPCIWKDNYGTVYISWIKSNTLWDGKGGVWYCSINLNSNNTVIYSKPRRLADGVMMNKPQLSFDNSSTFFPIALWTLSPTDPNATGVFIYQAQNNGSYRMYTDFTKFMIIPFASSLRNFDEHQILQLNDGSYIAFLRGIDGIYFTKNTNGVTWDIAKKFTAVGNTTSSRFFVGRLKSGKLALVLNNAVDRRNMKIFLSSNEGSTWSSGFLLDSTPGISYPDLVQDSNGKIYVIYDSDRYGVGNIMLASFTEDDVINNRTTNIIKNIISKVK